MGVAAQCPASGAGFRPGTPACPACGIELYDDDEETTMTSRPPLTAQDFQNLLTRADFGHSSLTITDTSDLPDVWAGQQSTCVLVTGPKDVRRQLFDVLYGCGVRIAPYPGRDYWRCI